MRCRGITARERHRRLHPKRLGGSPRLPCLIPRHRVIPRRRIGHGQAEALGGEGCGLVKITGSGGGFGREGEPPGLGDWLSAELGRPPVPGQGPGTGTALMDLAGGSFERGGDFLVGACGCSGQLPGATVGLSGRVKGGGQCLMDRAAQR